MIEEGWDATGSPSSSRPKRIQRIIRANQHHPVCDDGCGKDAFFEIVAAKDAPVSSGFQNTDHAAIVDQVNFSVTSHDGCIITASTDCAPVSMPRR